MADHTAACRSTLFDMPCSCSAEPSLPMARLNPVELPLRCGACDQIVGTAWIRWDGATQAVIEADADHHENKHLENCSIGVPLMHGVTRGISIALDGLDE